MTTPDLATIVDEQEAEIVRLRADIADTLERAGAAEAEVGRLVLELAVVHRDWKSDVGTLTARAQTAEARVMALELERNAYKRAKEENDERFMIERDAARAEAARYAAALAKSDPWTNDMPFNCIYCDAVWDADVGSSENQHNTGCVWVAAALRGRAQSEQPAERAQAAADRAALAQARALLAEAEARRMTRYETNDDTDFWYRVLGWLGGAR